LTLKNLIYCIKLKKQYFGPEKRRGNPNPLLLPFILSLDWHRSIKFFSFN